jgi:hypothetical protein
MSNDTPEFAIVPVPSSPGPMRALITADAIATGDMSAVMQNILDSHAQRDLTQLIRRADAAMRVESAIEEQKSVEREQLIQSLCDGISRMQRRLDTLEEQRALTAQLDEQSQQLIDTYTIPDDDGIDPDPFFGEEETEGGDYPASNLEPSLRDATGPESKGELPEFLKEPGPYAVPEPADLKNPQMGPNPPASIDL